ncbi:hypothetical protein LZ31DRAFT_597046 [Colletotrichum somersetense]|nr:hypothetical protein LZ31DRAFT_597046 [Colletotrichum somersetense]
MDEDEIKSVLRDEVLAFVARLSRSLRLRAPNASAGKRGVTIRAFDPTRPFVPRQEGGKRSAPFRPNNLAETRPKVLDVEDLAKKEYGLTAVCGKILKQLQSVLSVSL